MEVLQTIYERIVWESHETRPSIIYLDETWIEILQWYPNEDEGNLLPFSSLLNCSIVPFDNDTFSKINDSLDQNKEYERIIFLTSILYESRLQFMQHLVIQSGAPECAIICPISPITANIHYHPNHNTTTTTSGGNSFEAYEKISLLFEPAKTSIYYFPLHSLDILSYHTSNNIMKKVEVRILASNHFRSLKPLTLSGLGITINSSSEYQSIYDFPAADLPELVKTDLKLFAHEVAQSLVFDLGLDPTNSIYSLGRTSSLIGHNLLAIIDQLNKSINSGELQGQILSLSANPALTAPLKPASLILIDRWEDLFTPTSVIGSYPLAHRILNTLKIAQQKVSPFSGSTLDISLSSPWQQRVQRIFKTSGDDEAAPSFNQRLSPMSAVSGSGFRTLPSLRYTPAQSEMDSENARLLRYKIMACNEDEGRSALVDELKHRIFLENGNLPPAKKRGVGAEISALVQSLLESPGNKQGLKVTSVALQTNFNPFVCTRAERLIALSYAVIDAMQRSSAKQFATVCHWKASFDDRIQREFEALVNLFQYEDFDVTVALVCKHFLKCKKSAILTGSENMIGKSDTAASTGPKSPAKATAKSKLKTSSKDDEEKSDPVDVLQTLLLITGLLSLCRYKKISPNFLSFVVKNIAEYSLVASVEELEYWRAIGLFTESSLKEVIEWKEVLPTTDLDRNEIIEIISMILQPNFQKFVELNHLYQISYQKLVEKRVFSYDQSNPFDLMNDYHTAEKLSFSSNSLQTPQGLVSRIIQDCLHYKVLHHQSQPQYSTSTAGHSTRASTVLLKMLEHIENPLQQLAKKGFGLLSRGLGRLGFGSENEDASHPGHNDVIVLFVIGGISFKEVGQVQAVLQEYQLITGNRIILMSNNTICAEELLQSVFDLKQ